MIGSCLSGYESDGNGYCVSIEEPLSPTANSSIPEKQFY